MPDHINIHHPDSRAKYRRERLLIEELRAKVSTLESFLIDAEGDLEAIFTRIERGDEVELHMPSGAVFVITGKERE
ncbi:MULTISPECIES: hypothetical protein [unclassified Rhizobium]|uniref:hypothetical protein n=1 Tax=unclassified Rhizobium TaxID=2613769 RepID=UPI00161198EB|nr:MULTISPECIES: hypothetical protein [unclassified Rhizobium]MBB3297841.1 hypothetical protein [Rhizobium sp. BK112]MBB4177664.1 hypothetical protein [Rhizobium sp. BK109]